MTPILRVDQRAIAHTEDAWNGRTVRVQAVRTVEPIYTATDGMDDADFHSHELEADES